MAFDGDFAGMGFPVPMDPNLTDLDKLEEMQRQFVESLEDAARQVGIDPEQVRADAAQLAPYQPLIDFVEKWKGEDGLWTGDPIQRSQEYLEAVSEMGQRSFVGLFSTLLSAAERPPWDHPDTLAMLQGSALDGRAATSETAAEQGKLDGQWHETAPDGSVVFAEGLDPYWQQANLDGNQGDEVPGFQGTCGLTTVANMARMCGRDLSEGDVVRFAAANGLCQEGETDPGENGGTTADQRVEILAAAGIPSHVETGRSLTDLSEYTDKNLCVNLSVNAGTLWDNPEVYGDGRQNHSILLTGTIRDASGEVVAYRVCDSGSGDGPIHTVPADVLKRAWEDTGGVCVVTDVPRTQGYPPGTSPAQYA